MPAPAKIIAACVLALACAMPPPQAHAAGCAGAAGCPYLEVSVLGNDPQGHGVFRFPQGIAFSPGGSYVWVADQYSAIVQKFDRQGSWQGQVGGYAAHGEFGRFGVIGGLAADRNNHLYVLDSENDRVQVFRSDTGSWLGAFGSSGSQPGAFDLGQNTGAGGIAVQQATTSEPPLVYVADQLNHRIQRFTLSVAASGDPSAPILPPGARDPAKPDYVPVPTPDLTWGSFGDCSAAGCVDAADRYHLDYPQGVAVAAHPDQAGRFDVYVADDDNHRVVQYTPDGTFLAQVGSFGTDAGQFRFPYDVGVDSTDSLYVADNNNHRVQKFGAFDLGFLGLWGGFGPQSGALEFPRAIAALADDPLGGVYVADTANNRVQGFSAAGAPTAEWGIAGRGPGFFTHPGGVAVDAAGNVYVADTLDHRIEKLSADGTYLAQFGYVSARSGFAAPASGNGQFDSPSDVALDPAGNLWVADTGNNRVQALTSEGAWLGTWGGTTAGAADGQFAAPQAIAADAQGTIYVADTLNDRIERREPATGNWSALSLDRAVDRPRAVAARPGGGLFVGDRGGVVRIDGSHVTDVPPPPSGFSEPAGLWLVGDDLYVSDAATGRVLRRRASGAWESLGEEGLGIGSFLRPAGLATDPNGNALYVADQFNNRVQKLVFRRPPPRPIPTAAIAGPKDTRAPRITLRIVAPRRGLRHGRLVLSVRCDEPCLVTASARVALGRAARASRVLLLRSVRRSLQAGRTTRIVLRLRKRDTGIVRRALRQRRRFSLRIRVGASDGAGNRRLVVRRTRLGR